MSAFEAYEICLDALFCSDIVLSFLTGYWNIGVYEKRLPSIALHYIKVYASNTLQRRI
jgi:hypothetical protein